MRRVLDSSPPEPASVAGRAADDPDARRPPPVRRALPDVLGLVWTVAAALAVLAPALRPGVSLGPFDLLSRVGLTRQHGVPVHNLFPSDQVLQGIPWVDLAWHEVHRGIVPLWNPYNVLGTPLAFDWQSAVFSLPMGVAYLFPVHLAYTVLVLTKLVVAGTGAYVLCRVLGLRPLACAFGATVFELSGPMLHYSGWAMTGVTAWAGWILAAVLLVVRGDHRVRDTVFLALAVALAVYGGHPETMAVMSACLALFVAAHLLVRWHRSGVAPWWPLANLAGGTVMGLALAAPLLLPGTQVVSSSIRGTALAAPPYPAAHIADFVVALQGTNFRVPPPYLGAIPVVLAVGAGVTLWRRRPEIVAFAVVALLAAMCTYRTPFYFLLSGLPKARLVTLNRAVMLLALCLAVSAAFGLDALLRGGEEARSVRRWGLRASAGVAGVMAMVGIGVAGGVYKVQPGAARSFAWPVADLAVGVAALVALSRVGDTRERVVGERRARRTTTLLVGFQSAFLVASGVSFWSIGSSYFEPTPAVSALQRAVGGALVSAGDCRPSPFAQPLPTDLGIRPEANIAYGVSEFDVYDATIPSSYLTSWEDAGGNGLLRSLTRVGIFCPTIADAGQARLYGVSYVLEAPGARGPAGTSFVGDVGRERLFAVPGSGRATLLAYSPSGARPASGAPGTPVAVGQPQPGTWRVAVDGNAKQLLRLRLTASPGWHATLDGHPLALRRWADHLMLEAVVPAGRHVVELHYWPALFSSGLLVSGLALLVLVALLLAAAEGRRW